MLHQWFVATVLVTLSLLGPCRVEGALVEPDRLDRIRPLAFSGAPVAELPPGVQFGSFLVVSSSDDINAPAMNNNGQTVFFAELIGAGVTADNNGSLWMDDRGSLRLLAREGQPAPGAAAGAPFAYLGGDFPNIGDDGTVVFGGLVRDASQEFQRGIWTAKDGGLRLLALEQQPLPGRPTVHADAVIASYRVNNVGQVVTWLRQTELSSGTQRSGLYLFEGDGRRASVKTIVETGRAAPGTSSNYVGIEQESFALNDLGQVSYVGRVEASGIGVRRDTGIWRGDTGGQQLLVREGDPAVGTPAGTVFEDISQGTPFGDPLSMDLQGDVTFRARLAGPTLTNRFGVWTSQGGTVVKQLVEHDQQTSVGPGVWVGGLQFGGDKPPVSVSETGDLAYVASLIGAVTDDNDLAILSQRGNGLEVIARTGDPAPGAPAGSLFSGFSQLPSGLALNSQNRIAFQGSYRDPSTLATGAGIWAEDQDGALRLVVRTGDFLRLTHNESRVVESLRFLPGSGNADGQRSGFDNQGQLAFFARFTDGSEGMFVTGLAAVPEPTAAVLLAAAAVLQCLHRRRFKNDYSF